MLRSYLLTYSRRYSDSEHEYRHVQLPKNMLKKIPGDYFDEAKGTLKLLWEEEWRALGITQVTTCPACACVYTALKFCLTSFAEFRMGALRSAWTGATYPTLQVRLAQPLRAYSSFLVANHNPFLHIDGRLTTSHQWISEPNLFFCRYSSYILAFVCLGNRRYFILMMLSCSLISCFLFSVFHQRGLSLASKTCPKTSLKAPPLGFLWAI